MSFLIKTAEAAVNANNVISSVVPGIVDNIVLPLVKLLFALTVLIFIWGLIGFFKGTEDPEARKTGQQHILWGVVGIAIMISVYGIIRFVASSLGLESTLPF